jgi:hypothetical protein
VLGIKQVTLFSGLAKPTFDLSLLLPWSPQEEAGYVAPPTFSNSCNSLPETTGDSRAAPTTRAALEPPGVSQGELWELEKGVEQQQTSSGGLQSHRIDIMEKVKWNGESCEVVTFGLSLSVSKWELQEVKRELEKPLKLKRFIPKTRTTTKKAAGSKQNNPSSGKPTTLSSHRPIHTHTRSLNKYCDSGHNFRFT